MLSIRLEPQQERFLEKMALETKRSKSFFVKEA